MSGFQKTCPRKLKSTPTEPCHVAKEALEKMAMGDHEGANSLCPWAVRDQSVSLCFWKSIELEGAPMENLKEIASSLGISKKEADEALRSALKKIQESENLQEFKEAVAEISSAQPEDIDMYTEQESITHLYDDYSKEILEGVRHKDNHPDRFDGRKNRGRNFAPGQLIHYKGEKVNLGPLSEGHAQMMREFNKKSKQKAYYSGSSEDPDIRKVKSKDEKPKSPKKGS